MRRSGHVGARGWTLLAVIVSASNVMACVPAPRAALAPASPAAAHASASRAAVGDPTGGALQALLVVTDSWDAVPAVLTHFERPHVDSAWRQVGDTISVVVGRGGLGWGIGLHGGPPARPGPVKREGDGRAPAGVFRLGAAFGYAPAREVPWIRLPYIHATESWKCVDDPESVHYNRVLDERHVARDWTSHEDMLMASDAYRLGVIVQHNWAEETQAGAGSCIFLHLWSGPGSATVGCTAMPAEALEELLRWLDPDREPILVQLPAGAYEELRAEWRLP